MKKILSILLSASMLFGALPAYAAPTAADVMEVVEEFATDATDVTEEPEADETDSTEVETYSEEEDEEDYEIAVYSEADGDNRITNGDFSSGNEGWSYVTAYGATNWMEIGSRAATYGLSTADGNFCELQGYSDMLIYQTIESTAGETLVMEFDYAGRTNCNTTDRDGDGVFDAQSVVPIMFRTNSSIPTDFQKISTTPTETMYKSSATFWTNIMYKFGSTLPVILKNGYGNVVSAQSPVKAFNLRAQINEDDYGTWGKVKAYFNVDADMLVDGKVNIGISSFSSTNTGLGGGNLIDNISVTQADSVYVSSTGNNDYPGTPTYPLASLEVAYGRVADGGTIYVMDDLSNINNAAANYRAVLSGDKAVKIVGINYESTQSDPNVKTVRTLQYAGTPGGTQAIIKIGDSANITFEYITIDGQETASCLYVASETATVNLGASTSLIKPGKGYGASGKDYINNKGTVYIDKINGNNGLTLSYDGQIEGGGTIKRSNNLNGGPMLITTGNITIKNQTIDGNNVDLTSGGSGKNIILISGGKLTLDTGAVVQNSLYSAGGGSYVGTIVVYGTSSNAELVMNDGATITNNKNLTAGSAVTVFNSGTYTNTFTMNGGEISGNGGAATTEIGSTVYAGNGAKFVMNGGTIKNNNDNYAVYANNGSKMEIGGGAVVTDNTKNVYLSTATTLTLTSALTGTVGIYNPSDLNAQFGTSTVTRTSDGIVVGFVNDQNADYIATQDASGNLYWNESDTSAVYVSQDGLSTNPGIPNAPLSSIYLAYNKVDDGGTIYVMSDLTNINNVNSTYSAALSGNSVKTVKIVGINYDSTKDDPNVKTVRTIKYSAGTTQGTVKVEAGINATFEYITIDGNNAATCLYAYKSTVTLGEKTSLINPGQSLWATGKDYINSSGTIYVTTPITLSSEGQIECSDTHANIAGQNGTIKRAESFTKGRMFITTADVTIKNQTIDGNNVEMVQAGEQNQIAVHGGTLTLDSGAIITGANYTATSGTGSGTILVNGNNTTANLVMNDGAKITGNINNNYGSVVTVYNNTTAKGALNTFTMNGGEISGNGINVTKSTTRGAVFVGTNGAKFVMNGGTITNNNDVYAVSSDAANKGSVIEIGGDVTISGNTGTGNVYLGDASVLKLTSALTGTVGISNLTDLNAQFGTSTVARTSDGVVVGFVNDQNTAYLAVQDTDGKLYWGEMDARTKCDDGEWTYFESLAEAIAAATGTTNTVELLKDTTLTSAITTTNSFTLRSGTRDEDNGQTYTIKRGVAKTNLLTFSGKVVMENITVDGDKATYPYSTSSSGVNALISVGQGGSLTLDNGTTLKDNAVYYSGYTRQKAGAVYVYKATLIMKDGAVIEGCECDEYGSAIYLDYAGSSKFTMTGGEIRNNITHKGSTDAAYTGGSVNIGNSNTFTMTGGKITGNTVGTGAISKSAAGLVLRTSATLNISGDAYVSGNTNYDGKASNYGAQNVSVTAITVGEDFTGTLSFTNINGTTTHNNLKENYQFATAVSGYEGTGTFINEANPTYIAVVKDNTKLYWSGIPVARTKCDNGDWTEYSTLQAAVNAATGTDNIVELLMDITLTSKLTSKTSYTLQSSTRDEDAGKIYTIKRGIAKTNLINQTGGNVVMKNITIDGDKETYPYSTSSSGVSALVHVNNSSAKLTLGSGTTLRNNAMYYNNNAETKAGAVIVQAGTLTMEDGAVIENCECDHYSGAILVFANQKFIMTGGEIRKNIVHNTDDTTNLGGNIYISNNATMEMSGGIITENAIADNQGENVNAGVTLRSGTKLKISGTAVITGNKNLDGTESNLNMPYGDPSLPTITVGADFTGTLSVSMACGSNKSTDMLSEGKQFATAEANYAEMGKFINDTNGLEGIISDNDSTKLIWGVDPYVAKIKSTGVKYETLEGAYANVAQNDETIYLLKNYTLADSSKTTYENLTLNGTYNAKRRTLTVKSEDAQLSTGGTFTIADIDIVGVENDSVSDLLSNMSGINLNNTTISGLTGSLWSSTSDFADKFTAVDSKITGNTLNHSIIPGGAVLTNTEISGNVLTTNVNDSSLTSGIIVNGKTIIKDNVDADGNAKNLSYKLTSNNYILEIGTDFDGCLYFSNGNNTTKLGKSPVRDDVDETKDYSDPNGTMFVNDDYSDYRLMLSDCTGPFSNEYCKRYYWAEPVVTLMENGVASETKYYKVQDALEDYTDSSTQVLKMISNSVKGTYAKETFELDKDLYFDLGGYTVTASISGTGTLYGFDSSTNGYASTDKMANIDGTLTCNVSPITDVSTNQSGAKKEMHYVKLTEQPYSRDLICSSTDTNGILAIQMRQSTQNGHSRVIILLLKHYHNTAAEQPPMIQMMWFISQTQS